MLTFFPSPPLGLEASGACASVSGLAFLVLLEALLFFCPSKALGIA